MTTSSSCVAAFVVSSVLATTIGGALVGESDGFSLVFFSVLVLSLCSWTREEGASPGRTRGVVRGAAVCVFEYGIVAVARSDRRAANISRGPGLMG